jgi:hypothetical protein
VIERRLGGHTVADSVLDDIHQLAVAEDRELDLEDRGLFGPGGGLDALPDGAQPVFGPFHRATEVRELLGDGFGRNAADPHVRHFPVQQVHLSGRDSR